MNTPSADSPRHAEGARTARGDPDRHGPVVGQAGRPLRAHIHRFAIEQGAHQPRARLQLLHARGPQPGQPHRGVPHAPADDGAAGSQLVDGGDGARGHARVPVDGIGEERAERDALRRLGRGGEQHVRVAAPELRVRLERRVPAQHLRAPDVRREEIHRAGIEPVQPETGNVHDRLLRAGSGTLMARARR